MYTFQADHFNDVYPELAQVVMREGTHMPSRWAPCTEISPVVIEVKHPFNHLVTSSGRPVNVAFALAEALWILSGRRDVGFVEPYNSQIAQFSDNGEVFNAAYGHRLRYEFGVDQINQALWLLEEDPNTRQAVMNIWSPTRDAAFNVDDEGGLHKRQTKDRACNTQSILHLRDGLLHWRQIQRSNDLIWGTPYNWMQFSHLQMWMARQLGVGIGSYTHFVNSLHIYEDYYEEALNIRTFDLYEHLGYHEEMAVDPAAMMFAEEWCVRVARGDEYAPSALDPSYWRGVVPVWAAHQWYRTGEDSMALAALEEADPIYAAAQIRFYWANRWSKWDTDRQRMMLERITTEFPDPVMEWIIGEGKQ